MFISMPRCALSIGIQSCLISLACVVSNPIKAGAQIVDKLAAVKIRKQNDYQIIAQHQSRKIASIRSTYSHFNENFGGKENKKLGARPVPRNYWWVHFHSLLIDWSWWNTFSPSFISHSKINETERNTYISSS